MLISEAYSFFRRNVTNTITVLIVVYSDFYWPESYAECYRKITSLKVETIVRTSNNYYRHKYYSSLLSFTMPLSNVTFINLKSDIIH